MMNWISVKDRMPAGIEDGFPYAGTKSKEVLVFAPGYKYFSKWVQYENGKGHWEGCLLFTPTHWIEIDFPK